MNLIKTIGDKIKNKMDSGDISKDELMGEASELLSKMKEMGGEGQMKDDNKPPNNADRYPSGNAPPMQYNKLNNEEG